MIIIKYLLNTDIIKYLGNKMLFFCITLHINLPWFKESQILNLAANIRGKIKFEFVEESTTSKKRRDFLREHILYISKAERNLSDVSRSFSVFP